MPSAMASLGVLIDDGLAADFDLAAVGLVEAVEDRHQRRFAGAVLADDAADRAALDGEIDVAIGPDGAEALVDPDQLDCSFSHAAGSHLIVFLSPGQKASMPSAACQSRSAPEHLDKSTARLSISAGIATGGIGGGPSREDLRHEHARDRLTTLEIRAAEQEKTIEELSGQIAEQWQTIERLRKKLDALTDRFLVLEEQAAPDVPVTTSRRTGEGSPGTGCHGDDSLSGVVSGG